MSIVSPLSEDRLAVSIEEVGAVYRALLGRDPESRSVAEMHARSAESLEQFILTVVNSPERAANVGRVRTRYDKGFDGLRPDDEDLLRRHLAPGEGEPGFVKNFLGVRTRVSHADPLAPLSGYVCGDIPTMAADYHAHAIEFVGMLRAVEAGSGPFVAVELGAGWGSWSVSSALAAKRCGRDPIRLYSVEGSPGKTANMRQHYRDNGLDPDKHVIVNAVIGAHDGFALFPNGGVTGDWGAEAIFTDLEISREGYDRTRMISLETLLADETLVDLIHSDVQGAEAEVVTASVDLLTAKVRYLVVGTHGRGIEGRIMDLLLSRGWELENEQPAQISHSLNGKEALQVDGTQVWRNKSL